MKKKILQNFQEKFKNSVFTTRIFYLYVQENVKSKNPASYTYLLCTNCIDLQIQSKTMVLNQVVISIIGN